VNIVGWYVGIYIPQLVVLLILEPVVALDNIPRCVGKPSPSILVYIFTTSSNALNSLLDNFFEGRTTVLLTKILSPGFATYTHFSSLFFLLPAIIPGPLFVPKPPLQPLIDNERI
jgi:hypothetical protein